MKGGTQPDKPKDIKIDFSDLNSTFKKTATYTERDPTSLGNQGYTLLKISEESSKPVEGKVTVDNDEYTFIFGYHTNVEMEGNYDLSFSYLVHEGALKAYKGNEGFYLERHKIVINYNGLNIQFDENFNTRFKDHIIKELINAKKLQEGEKYTISEFQINRSSET